HNELWWEGTAEPGPNDIAVIDCEGGVVCRRETPASRVENRPGNGLGATGGVCEGARPGVVGDDGPPGPAGTEALVGLAVHLDIQTRVRHHVRSPPRQRWGEV